MSLNPDARQYGSIHLLIEFPLLCCRRVVVSWLVDAHSKTACDNISHYSSRNGNGTEGRRASTIGKDDCHAASLWRFHLKGFVPENQNLLDDGVTQFCLWSRSIRIVLAPLEYPR